MGGGRSSSRYPFTASQWQELEHQALIFKYMMSGLPVPPELILPIRRSLLFMDPTTLPFVHHPSPRAHQMSYARKAEDPEPWRCRRTDGKKWRCSKEAYPESKYCERHMHRGKSRSRKLVELSLATTNSASAHGFLSKDLPPHLPLSAPDAHPLIFPCSSSSSRNFLGFRKDINELPFLPESTGRETPCSRPRESFDRKQVTGSDFRSGVPQKTEVVDLERDEGRQKLRPFHCFFDEAPQRSKASWMSSGEDRAQQDSFSKTQLSISIPAANHEMPAIASQLYYKAQKF